MDMIDKNSSIYEANKKFLETLGGRPTNIVKSEVKLGILLIKDVSKHACNSVKEAAFASKSMRKLLEGYERAKKAVNKNQNEPNLTGPNQPLIPVK